MTFFFFFSSRRRHTSWPRDWSSDVCSSDLYAARRGWEVALECSDQGPFPEGRREGLRRLVAAARAEAVQGVVVRSLSHLARSLRHLIDLGCLFEAQGVALSATEDLIDTTDPGGAMRWRDWLEIS